MWLEDRSPVHTSGTSKRKAQVLGPPLYHGYCVLVYCVQWDCPRGGNTELLQSDQELVR